MQNEAFSRVLIDKELESSGWNLLDTKQVRFELSGSNGRADYVLRGQHGPLGVLEAKNEDVDPHDAKEQARGNPDIERLVGSPRERHALGHLSEKSSLQNWPMDSNELLQYIKENDLDVCPECATREGNEITLPSADGDEGCITCANPECGISWWPDVPQE